jgi:acetyl esterase/lipase
MDRATLDVAYSNSGAVSNVGEIVAEFERRSAAFGATEPALAGERDVRYGPAERQRFDIFPARKDAALTFVFIHGGYWQSRSKEEFAFVAEGPLGLGMNVALAEYTIAPDATMTEIVAEIGQLLDFLVARGASRIVLSGHSAGGHLAAVHRKHAAVIGVMPVSGLFDLEPISAASLNDKLGLSEEEIERFSPIRHIETGAPMVVTVGSAELPELIRHSRDYAAACMENGEAVSYVPVIDANHFSILFDLAQPDGVQLTALSMAMSGVL